MLCSVLLIAVICQSLCEVGDLFANIWAVSARYPCLTALVTHTGDGGSRTVRSQHHNHWSMIVLNSIIPFHFGFWSLPDLGICFDTVGWWQEGHSACKNRVFVCWWWWRDWRFVHLLVVITAASHISCWSKMENGLPFRYQLPKLSWKLADECCYAPCLTIIDKIM